MPIPQKNAQPVAAAINGKIFAASSNALRLQAVSFTFSNDVCDVNFQTDSANYRIAFAAGKWQPAETNMPQPALTAGMLENNSMIYPAKINAAYTWTDASTLQLVLRYVESPHTETFTCHFDGDRLTIEAARSFDYGRTKTVIDAQEK